SWTTSRRRSASWSPATSWSRAGRRRPPASSSARWSPRRTPGSAASMEKEVVIAGGGPGGAALAARLAALGLGERVLVLDRARFPRAKPCGGGLTGHAVEAMAALGFALDVEHAPAPEAEVRYGGFARRVLLPRPVSIVRREEYDASLLAQV